MSRLLALSLGHGPRSLASLRPLVSRTCAVRAASTSVATDQDKKKAYSATLLLPKTSLPLRVKNAPKVEAQLRDRTTHELYREQFKQNEGDVFILHDGPPYANGNLHMGHALNKILKDIINRYNVICGRKVHYIPGWDCHGLPIEHKALAALGKSHTALDPVSVRQEARKFALEAIDVQKEEFKQLGVMADWDAKDGVYRSLDHDFEIRQLRLFQKMVSKGFITHRHRPTYYSPSSRTALAEAELEYTDLKSTSVYVAFHVEESDMTPRLKQALAAGREKRANATLHLAIWTTTPWSLPGNMGVTVGEDITYAVVVNEKDQLLVIGEERVEDLRQMFGPLEIVDTITGKDLIGTRYTHLFHPTSSTAARPVIFSAPYVTAESGTGLVHSAPAHGHDDYDAFNAAKIPITELRCPIDDDGCFTSEVLEWSGDKKESTQSLVGLPAQGPGAKAMVEFLAAEGVLLAKERITHRYPIDWRTKKPIMVRATPQWFADVETLKSSAEEAIDGVNFVPASGRNRLSATVLSRSEWCISRQRSWGVPIPALFNAHGEALLTAESLDHIISVLDDKGVDHWWSGPMEDFIPATLEGQELTRGFDTLDVWFDSGTSWSLIEELNLRSASQPLADVYLEGSDQHRGWFQSSILTRLAALDAGHKPTAPYANLITHGFTTDEKGQKMSKSLGNGISPMEVINGSKGKPALGSDVLRIWAAGVDYTRDSSIGPISISAASEQLRKLRSALRFMLGNTANTAAQDLSNVKLSLVDRFILHELSALHATARDAYDAFTFNKVLQNVSIFTGSTLSAFYFDMIKDTLYCESVDNERRKAVVATLKHVLGGLVKVIAPITPHLCEEIYDAAATDAGSDRRKSSVFLEHWVPDSQWLDTAAAADMGALLAVRSNVLGVLEEARAAKHVRVPAEVSVQLTATDKLASLLLEQSALLPSILGVSQVVLAPVASDGVASATGSGSTAWHLTGEAVTGLGSAAISVGPALGHQCPRCWLYTAEVVDSLCGRCDEAVGAPSSPAVGGV